MPIYGADTDLGIAFQNSHGTTADITNSCQALPILSENISAKRPHIIQQNMRGVFEEGESYQGLHEVSGEIEMEAHPIAIGYLLGSFFGSATVTTSDNIYKHQWTPSTAPFDGDTGNSFKRPVTFCHVNKLAGNEVNYYNLVANTLEFSVANGELLKVKTGFIAGRDDGVSTAFTASYPAGSEKFTWDVASFNTGLASDYIKDLTISLTDPIEPKYYLDGGIWPGKNTLTGKRSVSISMTMHYENNSYYDSFWQKEKNDMTFTFEDRSTEIQSGYYNFLAITLRGVKWETAEANRSGPGESLLSLSGNAHYSVGDSQMLNISLTNTKSAY